VIRVTLAALLAHWRRHRLELAAVLAGLMLATALWTGVQAINAEARAAYDAASALLGQNSRASVEAKDGGRFDRALYPHLSRAGWRLSPVLEGRIEAGGERLRVVGVDPVTAPPGSLPGGGVPPTSLDAFITLPGQALAAPATANRLEGSPGLPPVIAAEGAPPGTLIVDIGVAERLLDAEGRLSRLVVLDEQPVARPPLAALAPALALRPPESRLDTGQMAQSFHLNLTAFGLLAFAVGLFIAQSAIGLAFERRRATLRTLRALGVPLRALMAAIASESLALALLAGIAGVGLGYLLAGALLPGVAATVSGIYGAAGPEAIALRPGWLAAGLGLALLGGTLAAAQGMARLARLPILAPAQPRAWARASARGRLVQLGLAAALALAALALARWGTGLIAGFALLGAMLLAAALALPAALAGALALLGRGAQGPLAQWFWADTRQQLPGLSLALMALMLALSANIGVSTMVGSFRQTFTAWLDQRLVADLYLRARDGDEARTLAGWLAPRAGAVLFEAEAQARLAGRPVTVTGITEHPVYRRDWPLLAALPDAWDRVGAGGGLLVSEQLARRAGLEPGDRARLAGRAFTVAGIYADYGNPRGAARLALPTFRKLFPQVAATRLGVIVPSGERDALQKAVTAEFGLPAARVTDQEAIRRLSLSIFERTFQVTGALKALTLAVAALALLMSLLSLAAIRLPQLAPVWAVGVTRAALARAELARAMLLAALTMAAALPVGLALAWALLARVNVAAFGWRLPMAVFPGDWAALAALALLSAALAALWPAWRLARIAPADLVKVVAQER